MFFRTLAALLVLSTGSTLEAQGGLRDPFGPLQIVDPFGPLQIIDTGGAVARALRAAPITVLVSRGGVGVARWTIAGQPFVFVRGVTADSLGAGQGSYFVFEVVREDSVRLVFNAPYREYSGRAPGSKERESELRACLFIRGSQELAYVTSILRGNRHFVRPALPRDGFYHWSPDRQAFVHAADSDAQLRRQCARASSPTGK